MAFAERRCGNCRLFRANGEPCASEDWVKEGVPRWKQGVSAAMSTSGLSKPKSGSGEIVVPFSAPDQIKDVIGVWTAGERLEEGFGVSVTSLTPRASVEPSGLNIWDNRGNSVTVMVFENELRVRWGIFED